MKTLIIILMALALSGCFSKKKESEKVVTYNLFLQNEEVPNECKPPLATEDNKRNFIKFRGKVNRCIDLVNQYPDLGGFENIKDCLVTIKETFSEVDDLNCRATVTQLGAEGSAISVINL
jgi:hypothetical protein